MSQPMGNPQDQIQVLQLTCDRLRQQLQFQAAFLGTASHELRAPINQIISLHQLVLEDLCESPAEEREFIAQANQTIHQVLKNLDTLISLSKLDIGATQPKLKLVELWLVLPVVQQFTEMKCINRHCRLTVGEVAHGLAVQTDMNWLQQLLVTLVEVALAADSRSIHLAATATDDHRVTLTLSCDAGLEQWPVTPFPAISSDPLSAAQSSLEASFSPGFSYQLVTRMVHHLQGTITQDVSPLPAQRLVQITLPRATV